MKKTLIAMAMALASTSAMAELDSESATVSMDVALFASITNLDDFVLNPVSSDGAAGSIYSGSDTYNLESNGQVRVTLSGSDLSNGSDSISTAYALDDSGLTFDTTADSVHNANHTVSADATLGNISAQKAGSYSGTITLTVSGI
ncbi:hypothetical protein GCM10023116_33230 [Kistimonas scapharcae]|uniref:Fimbrial protein n=1 Tax=Kistimonas scapharcae TaxID=1036133 RepID=A0ABP8V726_9GAMM